MQISGHYLCALGGNISKNVRKPSKVSIERITLKEMLDSIFLSGTYVVNVIGVYRIGKLPLLNSSRGVADKRWHRKVTCLR